MEQPLESPPTDGNTEEKPSSSPPPTKSVKVCSRCQESNKLDDKYCGNCGLTLSEAMIIEIPIPISEKKSAAAPGYLSKSKPKTRSVRRYSNLDVNDLGYYLDGWADLVENQSDRTYDVYESTTDILKKRYPPMPALNYLINSSSAAKIKDRDYVITTTRPGATTTIYIGPRGEDLFVSWRTYIKPVLNQYLFVALGIAVAIGFFVGMGNESFTFFLVTSLFLALMFAAGIALAGRLLKGDNMYYFFDQPTVFDAEDITAMSMAAHKSLHRALDKQGIDVKQLRLKQNFVGGRRDEAI